MKIILTVKKMTLKPSSKDHIESRLSKLDKFFDNAEANVMLRLENNRVTAEITIRNGSMVYRAENSQVDLIDAFDEACDNIVRRIRKQKTKLQKRLRPTAFDDETFNSDDTPVDDFQIIKTKHFAVKPLTAQEAVLQMELIGHSFYMFRNEESNEINVVYRRNDGQFGLIEPD